MDSPYIPAPCNPELAPRCCRRCGTPGSPKDSRVATQTLIDAEGRCYVDTEVRRDRLQCRVPGCPMWMKSWTVYEPGGYPHRRYALAVLVSAVSELAIVPEATFTSVAVRVRVASLRWSVVTMRRTTPSPDCSAVTVNAWSSLCAIETLTDPAAARASAAMILIRACEQRPLLPSTSRPPLRYTRKGGCNPSAAREGDA